MARGRIKGDHEARRREIAQASYKVILRLGLENTSLADIAREMGYTTGVLRHYFADKEELLLYAKNFLVDQLYLRARAAASLHEGIEKLRAMADEMLVLAPGGIDVYRLLTAFNGYALGNPQLMKTQQKRNESHWAEFAEIISELQRKGSLRKELDARLEGCGLMGLLDGLADQVIMSPKSWTREELSSIVNRHIDCLSVPLKRPSAGRGKSTAASLQPETGNPGKRA